MVATKEKIRHRMFMTQKWQVKTTPKMIVAEIIIAAHREVSPQHKSAQLGRKAANKMFQLMASTTVRTKGTIMQKNQTNSHQTPHGLTIQPLKRTITRAKALKIISRRRRMPQPLNGPHMMLKKS